jgi:hypothetical protein
MTGSSPFYSFMIGAAFVVKDRLRTFLREKKTRTATTIAAIDNCPRYSDRTGLSPRKSPTSHMRGKRPCVSTAKTSGLPLSPDAEAVQVVILSGNCRFEVSRVHDVNPAKPLAARAEVRIDLACKENEPALSLYARLAETSKYRLKNG